MIAIRSEDQRLILYGALEEINKIAKAAGEMHSDQQFNEYLNDEFDKRRQQLTEVAAAKYWELEKPPAIEAIEAIDESETKYNKLVEVCDMWKLDSTWSRMVF